METRKKTESSETVPNTVEVLANPLASAAAFGVLGLGLASHAFGMWLGAMTAAAEASQRLLHDTLDTRTRPHRKPVELRLVETPARDAVGAAARTFQADAEIAAREVVRATRKTATRKTTSRKTTARKAAPRKSPATRAANGVRKSTARAARNTAAPC